MINEIAPYRRKQLAAAGLPALPAIVADAGPAAARRFVEFFTANIRNKNTRSAYARAVARFLKWCEERALELRSIQLAAHESPRTTKLYDRTGDEITLDEVERIGI